MRGSTRSSSAPVVMMCTREETTRSLMMGMLRSLLVRHFDDGRMSGQISGLMNDGR